MHHSPTQRRGGRSLGQLAITSASVTIGHLQKAEFLITDPDFVDDQPKPTAFYQETGTLTGAVQTPHRVK